MSDSINTIHQEKKEVLSGVQRQIEQFDNKASILISVVGIMFALLLDFSSIFNKPCYLENIPFWKISFAIIFVLFCLSCFTALCGFILVILPRDHKQESKNNANYYRDLAQMDEKGYGKNFEDFQKNDSILDNQIMINAKICKKKEFWLRFGLLALIPFAISLFFLVIGVAFVFN